MEAPMVFQWEGCLFWGHAPNKKIRLGPGTSVDISGYPCTFEPWGWIKIIRFHSMFEGFRHPKAPKMAKKMESAEVQYGFGPKWLPWQTAELSIWGVQFHVFFEVPIVHTYMIIFNFLGILSSEVNFTDQKNEAGPKLVFCCCYLCFGVTDIVIHPGKNMFVVATYFLLILAQVLLSKKWSLTNGLVRLVAVGYTTGKSGKKCIYIYISSKEIWIEQRPDSNSSILLEAPPPKKNMEIHVILRINDSGLQETMWFPTNFWSLQRDHCDHSHNGTRPIATYMWPQHTLEPNTAAGRGIVFGSPDVGTTHYIQVPTNVWRDFWIQQHLQRVPFQSPPASCGVQIFLWTFSSIRIALCRLQKSLNV